ncbi:hypothetical protein C3L33_13205, partial [Rhododendron williamsianum]
MAVYASEAATPFLDAAVNGVVDYKNRPVTRSNSGGWRSAVFIIGVEVAERSAYYGISSNLITYLTGPLGQSTATAAEEINAWSGAAMLLPILGAFVADSFLGRYRTIIIASVLYVVGLGLLTLSAVLPSFSSSDCESATSVSQCSPPQLQVVFFFFSLYLVAVAQGGHKPCVQAFGADQFDAQDPQECKAKSSFFNWWYFSLSFGSSLTILILNYIQDNLSWGLGFGIPCIIMAFALIIFLLGTTTYRFSIKSDEQSVFVRIGRVFVRAARNWRTSPSAMAIEEESLGILPHEGSDQFRFLNKALLAPEASKEDGKVCNINEIEEAKAVLRLFPVWFTCLAYAMPCLHQLVHREKGKYVGSVTSSRGCKSSSKNRNRNVCIYYLYGCSCHSWDGKGSKLAAMESGIVDEPKETIPMSFWWLVPQYLLMGMAVVFTMEIGLRESFYDQIRRQTS